MFVQGHFLGQLVVAVQLRDVAGDDDPLGVLPRALADAITGIDRPRTADGTGAEVSTPGVLARPDGGGQRLAVPIGAAQTT
ncbi:hypothetical protein D9M69_458230 [compost metagenome]